ncbi:squalene epoxidase 2 [Euphorbia peplus]|nr:squalene epoxidase 2 [Euphorbia peplus]
MDYMLLMEGIIASIWALVFFCSLRRKKNHRISVKNFKYEAVTSAVNVEIRESTADTSYIIIVGAGVAGSALAYALAKDGQQVQVIERDLANLIELLANSYSLVAILNSLSLVLKIVWKRLMLNEYLDMQCYHSNVTGRSFHNDRFIQRMREKAASLPNVSLEQGTVTSLVEKKGTVKGVNYRTRNGQELTAHAPLTIVCDGCFSNLRRSLCNPKVQIPSCFVALVLEKCELPYANHGHVILADPSPILCYPTSSTEVRCLVDIPGQKVPSISNGDLAQYLKTKVAPQIPSELRNAFLATIEKGNIRTMPNRSMPASPHPTPGALLLGDAFNMRHPLTGGGMTVALSDIVLLRDLLRPLLLLGMHLRRFSSNFYLPIYFSLYETIHSPGCIKNYISHHESRRS